MGFMNFLTKKQLLIISSLGVLILFISVFFHFPIHILDAVSQEILPEFGIHIPGFRVVFEPFLGILLFFNRSLYALDEFQFVLYWILIVFFVYTGLKFFFINKKQARKQFLLRQLVNLPLVVGLWFTAFVVMIFIPLPNNTIVNLAENAILVNTHSHTEYSHDGLISQEGLWKWHKRNGFDAFFITDHNNHDFTFDFVQAQRNQKFPDEPLVMCGEEFSGSNHLSMLGLKAKFSTSRFPDSMAVQLTHAGRGAVIVNHWFDGERKSLEYYKNLGVDGFEIENTATEKTYNRNVYRKIKDFCSSNQLIMNGGVDFHGYGNVCSLWNAFEIPGWKNLEPAAKEEAILNIIKERDQNKLRVLLYSDRPYYTAENLILSPPLTILNYFRTLNILQVFSWLVWILIFTFILTKMKNRKKVKTLMFSRKLLPLLGILGAFFLLSLGLVYHFRIRNLEGFTEMYAEYRNLLFMIGVVFFIYSGSVFLFRILKKKNIK